MNQSILRRLTSRKFLLCIIPTAILALKWIGTGQPPEPGEFYAAVAGLIAGIGGIAVVDHAKAKNGAGTVIIALLGLFLWAGMGSTALADSARHKAKEARICQQIAPYTLPVAAPCERSLADCQSRLSAITTVNNVPFDALLASMPWYAGLPQWGRVTISGFITAVVVGGSIYAGTLSH